MSASFTAPGTQAYTCTITGAQTPIVTYSWRVYEPDGSTFIRPDTGSTTVGSQSTFTFDTNSPIGYYAQGPEVCKVRLRVDDVNGIRVWSARATLTIS